MDVTNPSYTVNATATDDIAVNKVEVLIDDVVVATQYTAPYSISVPSVSLNGKTSANLRVVVTDIGKKSMSTDAITIYPSSITTGSGERRGEETCLLLPLLLSLSMSLKHFTATVSVTVTTTATVTVY